MQVKKGLSILLSVLVLLGSCSALAFAADAPFTVKIEEWDSNYYAHLCGEFYANIQFEEDEPETAPLIAWKLVDADGKEVESSSNRGHYEFFPDLPSVGTYKVLLTVTYDDLAPVTVEKTITVQSYLNWALEYYDPAHEDESFYKEDSWKAYVKAYEDAEKLKSSTDEVVKDKAADALQDAYYNLALKTWFRVRLNIYNLVMNLYHFVDNIIFTLLRWVFSPYR